MGHLERNLLFLLANRQVRGGHHPIPSTGCGSPSEVTLSSDSLPRVLVPASKNPHFMRSHIRGDYRTLPPVAETGLVREISSGHSPRSSSISVPRRCGDLAVPSHGSEQDFGLTSRRLISQPSLPDFRLLAQNDSRMDQNPRQLRLYYQ